MLAFSMWAARSSCHFFSLSLNVGMEERVVERSVRRLSYLCMFVQRWSSFGKAFQVEPSLESAGTVGLEARSGSRMAWMA